MKRVAILGSTGSIGTQTIEVIRHHPRELQITALAAHSNHAKVAQQAIEFKPKHLAMFEESAANDLCAAMHCEVGAGMDGLIEIATSDDVDVVVVSVAGMIGLQPTIAALKAGKIIALASKEVLVAGGAIVMPLVRAPEQLRPIDSEHSAVLQCVHCEKLEQVEKVILTASGGPFRGWTRERMESVSVEQALNHPTWKMGGKITIDSATLMNKGLESIEACWLFGLRPDQVEVVIHPQSIIHSMVKFKDGSVLAQMGQPDMRLPIQYALLGPERIHSPAKNWEPMMTPDLTFEKVDERVFSCLTVARAAFQRGGAVPAYLNAVNEEAANAFLRGEIGFMDITRSIEKALERAPAGKATLETVLEADKKARENWRAALTYN